ncbi:hypothetical protein [Streptomyces sporangiiformans]|uniref:Uncharacterized protein n=1 Tax=Streptomyces sporangiiformans TaxID=2315329 RepID=A0A505DCD0_9ACTN|nr:hypothetical protein [Streptomyces sporangiiformans]TPQ16936.1 hypothetical protein FGD71_039180 [Streptomyces sporangiiformans]
MGPEAQWYVLVEANSDFSTDPTWELREKYHVEGDRAAALSRAEQVCRTWGPWDKKPEETGRSVFRTSETSWLVEVTQERWSEQWERAFTSTWCVRVTVAELVYTKEPPPAHPPEKKKPGVMRRALGNGR